MIAVAVCVVAIAVALATAAAIGHSEGIQTERRSANPHNHAESAKARASRACVGLEPAAMFECVNQEVERSEETARAEQDLSAQQDMALWALLMTLVSAVTALIATIALWFVRETLKETRAMTFEAQRTTKAAEDALKVTRDVATAELRPWVSIEAEITKVVETDHTIEVYYRVTFRNIGKTIATDVRTVSRHDFLGEQAGEFVARAYANAIPREERASALIPGEEIAFPGSHAQARSAIPWMGDPRRVVSVVIASVFYQSELDKKPHRTDRCFLFGWPGGDVFDHPYFFETDLGGDVTELVRSPFRAGDST